MHVSYVELAQGYGSKGVADYHASRERSDETLLEVPGHICMCQLFTCRCYTNCNWSCAHACRHYICKPACMHRTNQPYNGVDATYHVLIPVSHCPCTQNRGFALLAPIIIASHCCNICIIMYLNKVHTYIQKQTEMMHAFHTQVGMQLPMHFGKLYHYHNIKILF